MKNRRIARAHRRKQAHAIENGQRERDRWLWACDDSDIDSGLRTIAELELDRRATNGGAPWRDQRNSRFNVQLQYLRRAVRRGDPLRDRSIAIGMLIEWAVFEWSRYADAQLINNRQGIILRSSALVRATFTVAP